MTTQDEIDEQRGVSRFPAVIGQQMEREALAALHLPWASTSIAHVTIDPQQGEVVVEVRARDKDGRLILGPDGEPVSAFVTIPYASTIRPTADTSTGECSTAVAQSSSALEGGPA